MQAIILAAGMGRRLGELTQNNTKCMLEVNGIRLIDRYLIQLAKYNLDRIIIVVGYEGQKLIDYIQANYPDRNIEFVNNPIYDKTNNIYSLALAKEYLCNDDTILMESDLIVEDAIIDKLVNHPDKDIALVAKYEQWMDGTMVRIDDSRRILQSYQRLDSDTKKLKNTIKQLTYTSSAANFHQDNTYLFSKPIVK